MTVEPPILRFVKLPGTASPCHTASLEVINQLRLGRRPHGERLGAATNEEIGPHRVVVEKQQPAIRFGRKDLLGAFQKPPFQVADMEVS